MALALPVKAQAAPLSALGHSTTCNLPTMNTHTHTNIHATFFSLFNVHCSMLKLLRHNEICRNKGNTLSNLKRKGKGRREEGARRDVCGRLNVGGGGGDLIVCECVCVCVICTFRGGSLCSVGLDASFGSGLLRPLCDVVSLPSAESEPLYFAG